MIRLPNTGTYSLELITAQNGAQSVVSYSDATSSAYTGGTQVASITSATTTTICSTPAASTVRDVDQINIKNTFAGSHTVTVQVDANGTNYPLIVAALLTDESLNYTHGSGWQVKDANGNTKNSALSAMTSAQLAAILTDETGSGAAVFANGPTLIAPILGTPASGTVTNLTGTASININGTVGATTPAAGTFTTLTSTGNATLGDAEATDTHAIKGVTTLLANSASAALTITQTGAGNAFVVEDSASTDSTPFVIKADGNVGIGSTETSLFNGAGGAAKLVVTGADTATTVSNNTDAALVIANTDDTTNNLAGLHFAWQDTDNNPNYAAASIVAVLGAKVAGQYPSGQMVFLTSSATNSAPSEKLRIASDGGTTIGGASSSPAFRVFPSASQVNFLTAEGKATGNYPVLKVTDSSDTNTGIDFITKGSAPLRFYTEGGTSNQVQITHTASANRYITLTGSNGGNPTIGVSGGTIALSAGALSTSATNGLGYGTGAGGAVTQITSKSTAVSIDRLCGQITMHNAALAANTTVVFAVNNTTIAATDTVIVHPNFGTGAEGLSYNAWCYRAVGGGFYVAVRNITAGSLSEAVILNFTVIKNVTS